MRGIELAVLAEEPKQSRMWLRMARSSTIIPGSHPLMTTVTGLAGPRPVSVGASRLTAAASATASIEPTECPGVLSGCAGSESVPIPTSDSCRRIPYTVLYWRSEFWAACCRCAKRQR